MDFINVDFASGLLQKKGDLVRADTGESVIHTDFAGKNIFEWEGNVESQGLQGQFVSGADPGDPVAFGMSMRTAAADNDVIYGIKIADTKITSANAQNVFAGDSDMDGKVSYDPVISTLTLSGVNITHRPWNSDYPLMAENDLTIRLEGQNVITESSARVARDIYGIYCKGNLTSVIRK